MSNISYYTEEGLKKLKNELNQLKDVERPKASNAIAEARDKGDLSENAEYDAAKEAQGMLEMRISKLEERLANARVIDESQLDNSKVLVLSKVKIRNKSNGMTMDYMIVADGEADLSKGKISVNSPIGKGLLGKSVGEIAKISVPTGFIDLEILEILEIDDEQMAMKVFSNKGDKNNYKLIEYISKKDTTSALSVIESMKINDRNSVALLIWILSRDINAIKHLLDGRNIRSLGIWENQIQWYQKISSRIAPKTIEKLISKINIVDRKFKGVSKGDPWNGLKDIVLSLSA